MSLPLAKHLLNHAVFLFWHYIFFFSRLWLFFIAILKWNIKITILIVMFTQ